MVFETWNLRNALFFHNPHPMNIIRVFPRRTNFTPTDEMAFIGEPPLFRPYADEVHISIAFTWDIQKGYHLQSAWSQYYSIVRIGGPAFGNILDEFISGFYVKPGIVFTTRGCNNHCPWCLVPENEGQLIEIKDIKEGWIIQDNNLLQASHQHIEKVISMLRKQKKAAVFSGGLQASLIDDWFIEQLRTIRIGRLFLAADTINALKPLERALNKLSFLGRRKLQVYCMIGKDESIEQSRNRLENIWELGGLPFAQLFQPPELFIDYSREWKELAREWSRPAAMFSNHIRNV